MASISQLDEEKTSPASDPATDFRSRYAPETVGMPTGLATIATRNLAAQDASLTKVNAVARMNPLPAPGSTYATPQTDTANMGIANAMDRADRGNRFGFDSPQYQQNTDTPTLADAHVDNISQRRDALESQKTLLMVHLGMLPPSAAGLSGVVVPGTDKFGLAKRHDMLQQLSSLEEQSQNLLREHHMVTTAKTRDDHENFARNLHIQANTGMSKILNGIAAIKEPMGSDEHTAAAFKILGSNDPDIAAARGTPGFEKLLGPYAQQAKASAERAARIKEMANQPADQYYSQEALLKDNPGAEARQDPKTGGWYVALAKPPSSSVIPQAAYTDLGRLNAKKASDSIFLVKEVDPGRKADMQKKVDATQAAIDAWHETYSPKAATPAAASAPAATAQPAPAVSPQDKAAIDWSTANPKDPRAIAIKKLHGIQ